MMPGPAGIPPYCFCCDSSFCCRCRYKRNPPNAAAAVTAARDIPTESPITVPEVGAAVDGDAPGEDTGVVVKGGEGVAGEVVGLAELVAVAERPVGV